MTRDDGGGPARRAGEGGEGPEPTRGEPAAPDPDATPERLAPEGLADLAVAASRAFELGPTGAEEPRPSRVAQRLETDRESVERDLMKLVLTLVELLRQLMERSALRRVDHGDLTEDQEERIGMTLMILQERMTELRQRYGLKPEDLNLDLGPLGSLLPRD